MPFRNRKSKIVYWNARKKNIFLAWVGGIGVSDSFCHKTKKFKSVEGIP